MFSKGDSHTYPHKQPDEQRFYIKTPYYWILCIAHLIFVTQGQGYVAVCILTFYGYNYDGILMGSN